MDGGTNMELITTYICKKGDIGVHDNMFGGTILSIIDDAAAAYVSQICDTQRVVTLKINELLFKQSVKVGNILKVYGKIHKFGTTSVDCWIEVRKHNVYTGEQRVVTETMIKFVRIDDDGKPLPIHNYVKERYMERIEKYGRGLIQQNDGPIGKKENKTSK